MEQVFQLVNVILSKDRETKRRNLGVRSYKVIPLASQAGVLEFVQNTTPLQAWLSIAHPRYTILLLLTERTNSYSTPQVQTPGHETCGGLRLPFKRTKRGQKPSVPAIGSLRRHSEPFQTSHEALLHRAAQGTDRLVRDKIELCPKRRNNFNCWSRIRVGRPAHVQHP